MLTGKQKRHLRSLAHHLQPIFQVGKGGTNDQLVRHIEEAIEVRELIKISVLNNCMDDPREIGAEVAEAAGAELVQVIGKTIVLYKQATEEKYRKIELPKAVAK
ncbi:ribosome assembly RNA-binding protein YhbY [Paenibacillus glycanilyticus]|uniref:ribosome assembly RNA-binding protein YhbY n=1 Tax=Paenibacillus glycanilyticus TaxID=126569 RepID=UPI00203ACC0E|nr:ribosome assembly RNA-binding protein YhbY [Paenibacillus glycanilyticus]MCM3626570.1 ribosome assembly RNA-binding protein YhbY [Paenibacillus glycanilyticus]